VRLKASTKAHVHRKFEIFWTNIASTMACPNLKNGPKNGLRHLGVNLIQIGFLTTKHHGKPKWRLIVLGKLL
jgi:hypothetical protein